jgi:phosphotriesterase-related protein
MALKEAGLLHKVMLSHDGSAAPPGREARPMTALMDVFIPLLAESGFTQQEIEQFIRDNPVAAFQVRKRLISP